LKIADVNACHLTMDGKGLCGILRKLPLPDAGGRTSSVKTWLLLYTDAKLDIYLQGLDFFGHNVVFNALVISTLTYACQAFSGFLSSSELCRLQASLNEAYKYKLSLIRHDVRLLYEDHDVQFFSRFKSNLDNCLFQLLPSERDSHGRSLRSIYRSLYSPVCCNISS
jgi:hypothetical protein